MSNNLAVFVIIKRGRTFVAVTVTPRTTTMTEFSQATGRGIGTLLDGWHGMAHKRLSGDDNDRKHIVYPPRYGWTRLVGIPWYIKLKSPKTPEAPSECDRLSIPIFTPRCGAAAGSAPYLTSVPRYINS